MDFIESLQALSEGVDPDTGEYLPGDFYSNNKRIRSVILKLSRELTNLRISKNRRTWSLDKIVAKQERNLSEGKPRNANLPWSDKDLYMLAKEFIGNISVENLAADFERTELAIASQLVGLELMDEDDLENYKPQNV